MCIHRECTSTPDVPAQKYTQIQQIPKLDKLAVPEVVQPVKPKVTVAKVDGQSVAVLDKQGMRDLISLYSDAKANAESKAQLVTVANKVIDERNDLLVLAKQEEIRGNELRQQLADSKSEQDKDRLYNAIELNATRLLLILSVLSGM